MVAVVLVQLYWHTEMAVPVYFFAKCTHPPFQELEGVLDWWRWALESQLQPPSAWTAPSTPGRTHAMDALLHALACTVGPASDTAWLRPCQQDVARLVGTALRVLPHVVACALPAAADAVAVLLGACLCSPTTVGVLPGAAQGRSLLLKHSLVRPFFFLARGCHPCLCVGFATPLSPRNPCLSLTTLLLQPTCHACTKPHPQALLKASPPAVTTRVADAVCAHILASMDGAQSALPPEPLLTGVLALLDTDAAAVLTPRLAGLCTSSGASRKPLSSWLLQVAFNPSTPASLAGDALRLAARIGVAHGAVRAALVTDPAAGTALYHHIPDGVHAWLLSSAAVECAALLALLYPPGAGQQLGEAVSEAQQGLVEAVLLGALLSVEPSVQAGAGSDAMAIDGHEADPWQLLTHLLPPLSQAADAVVAQVDPMAALPGVQHRGLRRLLRLIGGVLAAAPALLDGGEHVHVLVKVFTTALSTR